MKPSRISVWVIEIAVGRFAGVVMTGVGWLGQWNFLEILAVRWYDLGIRNGVIV